MQPSWEKKSLEEQQRVNELIDEIGYSEGQRRIDEMVFGDDAFADQNERRALPGSGVPGVLGSPFRSGYGGQAYVFFYYTLGIVVIALIAFGVHTCAHMNQAQPTPTSVSAPGSNTLITPGAP